MRNYILISAITTCLIGCGGSGGDSSANSPAEALLTGEPGSLAAAQSAEENIRFEVSIISGTYSFDISPPNTSLDIHFTEYSDLVSASQIYSDRFFEPGCEIHRSTFAEVIAEIDEATAPSLEYEFVSAGDVLTITSPAGTWLELPKTGDLSDTDPFDLYDTDSIERVLGVLPANSTMDVPGDTFPQLSDIALLTPEPLTNVELRENGFPVEENETFTPNATIHWNKVSNKTDSAILLTVFNITETDISFVDCLVEDNGQYAFPATIREMMDETYADYFITRFQQQVEQRENVLISQTAFSQYSGF